VGRQPLVLAAHAGLPARDVPDLLARLRQKGDTADHGATNHLAGELLKQLAALSFTVVPYRMAAIAVRNLVAGRVQLIIDSPTMLMPLLHEGKACARGSPYTSLSV
jgi:tripartite-type tricarboxylate transporter receptor subunit TctC